MRAAASHERTDDRPRVHARIAWVEELHRHCTDHGGARVRQVLIDPALALEEQYDVLVVSHRWPALTHGLVDDLHARGRMVLGVYDRDEPVGRDLLEAARRGRDGRVRRRAARHRRRTADALRRRSRTTARGAAPDEPSTRLARGAAHRRVGAGGCGRDRDRDRARARRRARRGARRRRRRRAGGRGRGSACPSSRTSAPRSTRSSTATDDRRRARRRRCRERASRVRRRAAECGGVARSCGRPSCCASSSASRPRPRYGTTAASLVVDVDGALEDLPVSMARPRHAVDACARSPRATSIVAVGCARPRRRRRGCSPGSPLLVALAPRAAVARRREPGAEGRVQARRGHRRDRAARSPSRR